MIRRSGYHGGIDSQTRMPWMSNFRPFDRETGFLLPPSLDDRLPERHLARFVVEVIGSLEPIGDGAELSGHRLGLLSSRAVIGCSGLRLYDRGVFESQAGAGDI